MPSPTPWSWAAHRDRRVGWALIVIGLILAAAAQLTSPLESPPLYDGVDGPRGWGP